MSDTSEDVVDDTTEEEMDDETEEVKPREKKSGSIYKKLKRGRPAGKNPKTPYKPTGKPRGRPKSDNPRPAYVPNGNPRGRKAGWTKKLDNRGAHFRKAEHEKVPRKAYVPTGKPRGRPSEGKGGSRYFPTGKPRGRPKKTAETDDDE